MKFNFLVAIAILICILGVVMAFVVVTAKGDQPPATIDRWCTVSGMVVDAHKNGIPGAIVTMYEVQWEGDTYQNVRPLNNPDNPQYTVSSPEVAALGTYTFYTVPLGIYNLTAEKADSAGVVHTWFAWVNASQPGTYTNNIAITDYLLPPESPSYSAPENPTTAVPPYTISGFVTDKNKNGVPGARVSLYEAVFNSSSEGLDNVKLAGVSDNPQSSISGPNVAGIGSYTFFNVSPGLYNVTAEKTDSAGKVHAWYAWVNATTGPQTVDIAMLDYIIPV